MACVEFGKVEDIVEQLDQHLARVVGDRQLLALFTVEGAVQRERDHAQQTIEGGTDFVAHVGQKRGPRLGHVERRTASALKFFVGLAQAHVAGLELSGARRNNILQLGQIVGQAIFGGPALMNLGGHAYKLLIGNLDQHTDFVSLVARRALQLVWPAGMRVALAQGLNDLGQGFGKDEIKQDQQDAGEHQRTDEPAQQGELRAGQEAIGDGACIDLDRQGAEAFIRRVGEKQWLLESQVVAEQMIVEHPVVAHGTRAADIGQYMVVVIDQRGSDDGLGAQQAAGQFFGQIGIYGVGNARGRVVANIEKRAHLPVDGLGNAGIIDGDLHKAEHCPQDKADYDCESGLLVGQALGELDIHGG